MTIETTTVVTPIGIVEVTQRANEDGKTAHQIIKEYVAERTKTKFFDIAFDAAMDLGIEHGNNGIYEYSIKTILHLTNISIEDVMKHLNERGINL